MLLFGENYLDALDDLNDGRQENNFAPQIHHSSKFPKLRIHRLSEDQKFVPIQLDIEINDKLIIKERFFWNLNDEHISPSEFILKFCQTLHLSEATTTKMTSQFLFQLTDYIVNNTYMSRAKMKKAEEKNRRLFEEDVKVSKSELGMPSATPDQMDVIIEDKQTARQRKLEEQKKLNSYTIPISSKSNYFKDQQTCQYCTYKNISPIQYCQQCSVPFYISDKIKKESPRVQVSLKFFERIMNQFPILCEEVIKNRIPLEWFESTYSFKQKFQTQIKNSEYLDLPDVEEIENIIDQYFELLAKGQEIPESNNHRDKEDTQNDQNQNQNNNEMDEEEEHSITENETSNNALKPSTSVGKQSKEKIKQNQSSESEGESSQNSDSSNSENQSDQNVSNHQKAIKKRGRPPQKAQRGRQRIK